MKKRSRIRETAAVVAASAVALVAVQGSSAAAGGGESPTVCVGTRPVGSLPGPEPSLFRVLAYIEKRGETRYRSVFTGLSVDEDRRTADVYRIPSRAFDADICAHAEKGVRVRVHDTDVTARRLDALVERIGGDDMSRWDDRFDLRSVGPDPSGFVHIGVDDPATADLIIKKALGKFWAKHIRVEYEGSASLV
ncbi:hypothetical protein [Streptomyces sp. NBC_00328]|uniref:hypothetical protein n=1 Tax=Streptomyces sp. NBC_00328 TaxID=2903646 RepID=UPI002E2BA7EB|nr:hypothetical protein [Streptomyces sp. NBC_00328]